MSVRTVLAGLLVAVAGSLCAAGAYWALLNVPESSVLALLLSAFLALLAAIIVGYTVGVVVALASGASLAASGRRGVGGLAGFVVGLLVFCALFWATSTVDDLWALHRGEIDAMFLRYAGTANTAWVHSTTRWTLWLVRWGVGLALVGGAVAGAVAQGGAGAVRGLGAAFSPRTIGATLAGLVIGRALWPLASWRPRALPADSAELLFVGVKLGALFLIGALMIVLVLQVFGRKAA